jgi:transcriptional regulator with XRE-family HTH domain
MEEFNGIGPALRRLRLRRGLLQKELAASSKVSKTLISGYETGRTEPSLSSLSRLLVALGYDRFDLLNALEEVNGRPPREFPVARSGPRPAGSEILDALGLKDLEPDQEEDFLRMVDGFRSWFEHCRALVRRMGS